jgi:hypothetical protein
MTNTTDALNPVFAHTMLAELAAHTRYVTASPARYKACMALVDLGWAVMVAPPRMSGEVELPFDAMFALAPAGLAVFQRAQTVMYAEVGAALFDATSG